MPVSSVGYALARLINGKEVIVIDTRIGAKYEERKLNTPASITNQSIIISTSIDKIPPTLPLPAFSREKIPKGGVTPLWQRGASVLSYKFVDKLPLLLYSGWRKENDHDHWTSNTSPPPERR